MTNMLTVSPSPHIRSSRTTTSIMANVLIALLPAAVASVILFGYRALLILAVSNLSCGLLEWGWCKVIKKNTNTIGDLSAFVTGTLLALTLPATMGEWQNLWMVAFGAVIAIIVVKWLFGGIGYNFANPAITARIVLLLCFTTPMAATVNTTLATDAVSGATPLADIAAGNTAALPSLFDMLIGNRSGAIGEGCTIALLIGGIYLIATRIISWHIPVTYIATVGVLTLIFGAQPLHQLMAGGLIIGAFFMATDYTTSPDTAWGKVIFGVGCGLITVLIRLWGSYPEGVSYAILLMNIVNPFIIKLTRRKPFGGVKE